MDTFVRNIDDPSPCSDHTAVRSVIRCDQPYWNAVDHTIVDKLTQIELEALTKSKLASDKDATARSSSLSTDPILSETPPELEQQRQPSSATTDVTLPYLTHLKSMIEKAPQPTGTHEIR